MAKARARVLDYLVYLLVRSVVCIVQVLSWDLALALARGLGWLAYRIDRRHRSVALDNLRHAFPGLDEPAREALVRDTYLHFATVVVEMIRLPRTVHRGNLAEFIQYADPRQLARVVALTKSGRAVMAVTGHFGNWEVLSYATGLLDLPGGIIARRLDNPYLDRFIAQFRRKTGLTLLDKNEDYPRILAILQGGGRLGLVGDQDAGSRGLFVEFFGRPASTFKSIALLSLEYQAPIVVVGAVRVGRPMRYRVYCEDIILPEDHADQPDAARVITQRYTEALERMVRWHPEQYFWLHRRWKHQPPVRKGKKAA